MRQIKKKGSKHKTHSFLTQEYSTPSCHSYTSRIPCPMAQLSLHLKSSIIILPSYLNSVHVIQVFSVRVLTKETLNMILQSCEVVFFFLG